MQDYIIILIYLLLILVIGLYYRSKATDFKRYNKLGLSLRSSKILLLATMFATSVGGGTTFGLTEKVYLGDLSYSIALILSVVVDLVIATYLVPKFVVFMGCITVGDILYRDYSYSGKIIGGISSTLISIGYLAAQISVTAKILQYFFAVEYFYSVIISYLIVVIYTVVGGLRSIVITDLIQFSLILSSIPIILIFSIKEMGGINNFFLTIQSANIISTSQLVRDSLLLLLSFSLTGLHPTFIQRILISNNSSAIQKAIYKKVVIYCALLVIITLIGLSARILTPGMEASQAILITIDKLIPTGLKGIVICGFLASAMSTADSDLNIASVSIVNDLLKPAFKIAEYKLLIIARIVTVLVGSLAIILALNFTSIVDLIIFVSGLWSPVVFVPLIATLLGKKISEKGFVLSSMIGILTFALWSLNQDSKLNGIFIGTLSNFICFSLIYILSKAKKTPVAN